MRPYRGLTKKGEWVYGWYADIGGTHYIIPDEVTFVDEIDKKTTFVGKTVIPASVGQQTGRKDKNGKEGYHEDICLYKDDSNTLQKGVIEWRDQGAAYYFEAVDGADEGNQDGDLDREFEIIGNVHEKQELLER